MKNTRLIAIFLLSTLLISACGGGEAAPEGADTLAEAAPKENTATMTPEPAPTRDPEINPLTGLDADPEKLARRPVMVKVSNYPQYGRPHAGLSFADIVFDYFIGSGTNRFLAVFYGRDSSKIGPVRSGRMVDVQLVQMYGGILGYGSADEDTDAVLVGALGERAISFLEAPCPAFCGLDTHSEVGVFAGSDAITDFAKANGINNNPPDLPGMHFSDETPLGGKIAESLLVLFNFYNRGEWRYDHPSGKYLRWIEEMDLEDTEKFVMIPLVDRVTGEQLAFDNVIIIRAKYDELAPSRHEIDIWGNNKGQPAYFFRNGQVFDGTWRAANDTDPMQFFHFNGGPMPLKPGNTWVVIAGNSSLYQETSPGNWEMFFMLP